MQGGSRGCQEWSPITLDMSCQSITVSPSSGMIPVGYWSDKQRTNIFLMITMVLLLLAIAILILEKFTFLTCHLLSRQKSQVITNSPLVSNPSCLLLTMCMTPPTTVAGDIFCQYQRKAKTNKIFSHLL